VLEDYKIKEAARRNVWGTGSVFSLRLTVKQMS